MSVPLKYFLAPEPDSIGVSVHPNLKYEDAVWVSFTHLDVGYVIGLTPDAADILATLLSTRVPAPRGDE